MASAPPLGPGRREPTARRRAAAGRRAHRVLARRLEARPRGAARRVLRPPGHAALLREHARLVDRVVRGVWREADMPPELGAARRRRLRPRPAVPAFRRRRADPAARRGRGAGRGDRALLRHAVGHRHRAGPCGAHGRGMRSRKWPATSRSARACSRTASSTARGASTAQFRDDVRATRSTSARSTPPRRSSSSSGT